MRRLIFIAIVLVVALSSCLKEKTEQPPPPGPCDTGAVSFSTEIQPEILDLSCNLAGCHDASTASGGYTFTTHADVSASADIIWEAINHSGTAIPMPQGSPKLTDSLIQKIDCWIQQGKLDN